ncbi:n-acetylglutamate synthase [Olivibacter sp. SDN3]|uniref:n-acetylglutamate synthase n=1 Tax=Olivibacter sp. SDN3 TaxID=2764720 RepID=UPI001651505D|nr:n-acetylglutamate synthase [Olivibacter sp. SDN3]QNL51107.1 n-acetylglutamate synthase [Olivibacter sp. SDN3]
MINYHNRRFRPVANTENGETTGDTIFHYKQVGNMLTAEYKSVNILSGHLMAIVTEEGVLNMVYHQINKDYQLRTGKCISKPELLPSGKLRLHESWEWTNGDLSSGQSILEEI